MAPLLSAAALAALGMRTQDFLGCQRGYALTCRHGRGGNAAASLLVNGPSAIARADKRSIVLQ